MATYLLIMQGNILHHPNVGALGQLSLEPGCYLYVGSARRLDARLRRHLRADKKRRWHVDYLLNGDACEIREIWAGEGMAECELAASLLAQPGVTIPKPRLGASDCRCPAHFFRYHQKLPKLRYYLDSLGFALYSPP